MKLNLPAALCILIGALLIYSAYRDEDPRRIIGEALGLDVKGWDKAGKAVPEAAGKVLENIKSPNPNTPGVPVVTV